MSALRTACARPMPTSSTPSCSRSSRPSAVACVFSSETLKPGANHMRLVIIGAGFAGMYAALSAARLRDIKGTSPEKLEIALVAPQPTLVVRPRLYESKPETLTAPMLDVLRAIDVVYVQGSAEMVDTRACEVEISISGGKRKKLSYDRLVVATGSRLFRPKIPGLAEHGFSVDSLDDAIALAEHLHGLADRPAADGRDTVVVAGGGFTGIEAATEMPSRLRNSLGNDAEPRVIIVERNAAGLGSRPHFWNASVPSRTRACAISARRSTPTARSIRSSAGWNGPPDWPTTTRHKRGSTNSTRCLCRLQLPNRTPPSLPSCCHCRATGAIRRSI